MDRATLFSLVLEETHRADKEPDLPGYLRRAEAKIARELRCEEMSATATVTLTDYSGPLPDDFLGARAVYASDPPPYQQVGLMEFRTRQDRRVYAISNRNLLARAAELQLDYFARLAPLAADADTNAVLDAHEDLYVSLLSFYVHSATQDLELANAALNTYNDARDTLNELADRQRGAGRVGKGYNFGSPGAY